MSNTGTSQVRYKATSARSSVGTSTGSRYCR